MTSAPRPHLNIASDFLQAYNPGGPWVLCAFHESRDEKPAGEFGPDTLGEMSEWMEKWNADGFNIYFHVNACRKGLNKKALKTDIMRVGWLHVDVDPETGKDLREEQVRILGELQDYDALPAPTVILFSGGGYQAFWKLAEPIEVKGDLAQIEEAERYNIQIAGELGGDNCHNADRIMRVPGTVNWPNKKKQKNGQQPAVAEVILAKWEREYPIGDFVPSMPLQDKASGIGGGRNRPEVNLPSGNVKRLDREQLRTELAKYGIGETSNLIEVIEDGESEDASVSSTDRSRSGWFLYCVCEMVRNDVPDEIIYAIVTDPAYGISGHPISQGRGMNRAVKRAIMKGKEEKVAPELADMNEHHAHVLIGGKSRYLYEYYSQPDQRMEVCFLQKDAFMNMHASSKVLISVSTATGTAPKEIPVAQWWNSSPNRREYTEVTFYPNHDFDGVLNLWRGFNVEARPGDCRLYLDMVRNVICGGNEAYYNYLIGWMANTVQNPHEPGQTAVVLRGGQGTGKGTFAGLFGMLFGMHYKHIVNPDHITGQFNSALTDAALVFADECFVVGDKKQAAALKTLITESRLRTEAKGLDSIDTRNCVHLIMATNSEWAVAAELDDRRFFVLNVSDDHKQDTAYFRAVREEMANGGYEALMHLLMTYDLTDFDVRVCPKTDELRVQQERTAALTPKGFVREVLMEGAWKPEHGGFRVEVVKDELLDALHDYMGHNKVKKTAMTKLFGEIFAEGFSDQHRLNGVRKWRNTRGQEQVAKRPRCWAFPSLDECRRLWDQKFGTKTAWPEVDQESPDDYESEAGDGGGHF